MYKLAFDLVSDEKKSKFDFSNSEKFFYIGIIGFLLLLSVNWITQKYLNVIILDFKIFKLIAFVFAICLIIGNVFTLFSYNGNNRFSKGFITFEAHRITINHAKKIDLDCVDELIFYVNDYKGKQINLFNEGSPNLSYGGDNFVEFSYLNKKHKNNF